MPPCVCVTSTAGYSKVLSSMENVHIILEIAAKCSNNAKNWGLGFFFWIMLFEVDYAKNYASILYQCLQPGRRTITDFLFSLWKSRYERAKRKKGPNASIAVQKKKKKKKRSWLSTAPGQVFFFFFSQTFRQICLWPHQLQTRIDKNSNILLHEKRERSTDYGF